MENDWENFNNLTYNTEKEVGTRLILPLLKMLGWEDKYIHADVRVNFQEGRKKGRPHSADFVVAASSSKPVKDALIVIEAKAPEETLEKAIDQALSYAQKLKAPFYLITNGIEIQIWQVMPFKQDEIIFSSEVKGLAQNRGKIEAILTPNAVSQYRFRKLNPNF